MSDSEPDLDIDEVFDPKKEFKVKCKAMLLTYNSLPEEMTLPEFIEQLKERFEGVRWTACKEKGKRDHFHLYLERCKGQFQHELSYWSVNDLKPSDCQTNLIKGSGARNAMDRGHFYVHCKFKNTHIDSDCNWEPAKDYIVRTFWIQTLWQKQKINSCDVLPCAAHYMCLTPAFAAMVRITTSTRDSITAEHHNEARRKRLKASFSPFKTFKLADAYRSQFQYETTRYKFLVITGPSLMGKTQLAKSWFLSPFVHSDHINWDGYNPDEHDAVIFDDIPDIYELIKTNHTMFQSSGVVTVNTSKTNCYSQKVDLTAMPIVVVSNFYDHDIWLKANSAHLEISEPTWEGARG